jgi:hypothetical protein
MTALVDTVIRVIGIAILVAVVGVAGYVLWSMYGKNRKEKVYHFRCPGCHHKLRGSVRQVGHKGMCNNCKEMFTFPPV